MSQRLPALISATNILIAAALRQLIELDPSTWDVLPAVAPFFAMELPNSLMREIGHRKRALFFNRLKAPKLHYSALRHRADRRKFDMRRDSAPAPFLFEEWRRLI